MSSGTAQFAAIQAVAPSLGVEVSPVNVRNAGEIERGVAAVARSANGGLIVPAGGWAVRHRDLIMWLNHNQVGSPPGRCLGCGGTDRPHDPLLTYGVEPTGHAWLHPRCWSTWHEDRKVQAVAALANLGIAKPPDAQMAAVQDARRSRRH